MRTVTTLSLLALLLCSSCGSSAEGELEPEDRGPAPTVDASRPRAADARAGSGDGGPDAASPALAGTSTRDAAVVRDARVADAAKSQPGAARDASADGQEDAGTPGSGATGCAGALLCADFEARAELPEGWTPSAPDCMGEGNAEVAGEMAHGGARALRVSSKGGYCNHAFAKVALPAETAAEELWVRFHVRFESAPGNEHVTFVAMHDRVSGKHLRMGFQSGILMWNREKDDATLPELSPIGIGMSVMPKTGAWQCIEFHLAQGTLETFVDGEVVPGLTVDGTPTLDVDGQWLRPGAFTAEVEDLRLGWESYGSQPMTLWFDDVAVGSARLGC